MVSTIFVGGMDVLDIFGFLAGWTCKMERSDICGVFLVDISDDLSGEMCFSDFNLFNVLPSWISLKSYINTVTS